jgi:phage gpG-like protein
VAADTPEQAAAQLNSDANRLADNKLVAKILKLSAMAMKSDVRENFDKSAGPDGRPWQKLKFPRVRGGDKPLLDTGLLRASITTKAKDHIETFTLNSVEIGTTKVGANLMNSGGTIVPTKAKALAIPLTKEALRAGGPRRFPRPLRVLWRKGAPSGVLAEINTKKTKVSKREKSLRAATANYVPKQRAILAKIKKYQGQAKKTKSGAQRALIEGRIKLAYLSLKKLTKAAGAKQQKRSELEAARKRSSMVLQYALVKSVTVPARPFVGFGQRLITTLETISQSAMQSAVGTKQPGGAI